MEQKKTESSPEPVVDEMHWGIVLRSDIQDLRQETRADIQGLRQEVRAEIQDLRQEVGADIQDLRQEVRAEIQDLRKETRADIQDLREDTRDLRSEMGEGFAAIRQSSDHRFYWTIGVIVTLFGLQNGIMVAVLKL